MTEGFEAGADDYISRSAEIAVTKARSRRLLRGKCLLEENRRVLEEIREKELDALRAPAEREAAELRARMADQLATANRELDLANRELDRANRQLEHFADSAAHDPREPLRDIRVFGELLSTKIPGPAGCRSRRFDGHCMRGATRMDDLVNDLPEYARATQPAPPERRVADNGIGIAPAFRDKIFCPGLAIRRNYSGVSGRVSVPTRNAGVGIWSGGRDSKTGRMPIRI